MKKLKKSKNTMIVCKGSYSPIKSKRKCEWLTCYAGLGLVGSGFCFAFGAWWMQCCPTYKNEDKYLNEHD